jgi:hypothetical protein
MNDTELLSSAQGLRGTEELPITDHIKKKRERDQ